MDNIHMILSTEEIPEFYNAKQLLPDDFIDPQLIEGKIAESLKQVEGLRHISPGSKISITAGSRGISNIEIIIKGIVNYVKGIGAYPIIIPCMGSHGGDAFGQVSLLGRLGITEDYVGAPIIISSELVIVGNDRYGHPVYVDKHIVESDAVIVVNRIKSHTAFSAAVESGLQKMMAVGMGKQKGAEMCHSDGFDNMYDHIISSAEVIMKKVCIIAGVAIIENAYGKTNEIIAVNGSQIPEIEPMLLKKAKGLMPKLLFDNIDVLIVEEMGKDISGSGMDTNIIGRFPTSSISGGPKISRLVVLDLTEKSEGNAHGVGFADFTTKKLVSKMKPEKTYPNCLTNKVLSPAKIPPIMPNDELSIKAAIKTLISNHDNPRVVWIKNTHHLANIRISRALLDEAKNNPRIETETVSFPMKFDSNGDLINAL